MDRRIIYLKNYLLSNLQSKITVEEMAAKIKITPSHFQKLFKVETGETPASFLQNLRLEKAKVFLESKEGMFDSIKQVCFKFGFADQRNFARDFQKKFGASPSEFRKQSWANSSIKRH